MRGAVAAAPRSARIASLDAGLALGFALLAGLKAEALVRSGGSVAGVSAVLQSAVFAVVFLVRRAPASSSRDPADVALAAGAVVLPLLLAPPDVPGPLDAAGLVLQSAGGALALAALLALGSRFGVLPAHRGLCTTGVYAYVRHPMYAAYLLAYLGHALREPSPANVAIVGVVAYLLHVRARREEALLMADPDYAAYRARVRWRAIPAVH